MLVFQSAANEAADYFQDWYNEAAPATRTISIYIPSKTVGATKVSAKWVFNGLKLGVKTAETQPIPVTDPAAQRRNRNSRTLQHLESRQEWQYQKSRSN